MVCLNVGTRLNGWVPFFCVLRILVGTVGGRALFEGEKNFFQNFWIGVLGFLVFLWGFFIVDVEIYWIIYYIYRNIKMNM